MLVKSPSLLNTSALANINMDVSCVTVSSILAFGRWQILEAKVVVGTRQAEWYLCAGSVVIVICCDLAHTDCTSLACTQVCV